MRGLGMGLIKTEEKLLKRLFAKRVVELQDHVGHLERACKNYDVVLRAKAEIKEIQELERRLFYGDLKITNR